jgi:HSP20 family protein
MARLLHHRFNTLSLPVPPARRLMARDSQRFSLFLSGAEAFRQTHWQPSVDAYRTTCGWVLKYELAGVRPEEVQLAVGGRVVSLRGLRRDIFLEEHQQAYSMEISYNQFERVVELPEDLSHMLLSTDYRDGMLIVRLTNRT